MNIKEEHIEIANVDINVVRKDIKNMHLAVYPPNGRIRLSAPNETDREVLRLFAISKLPWIKKHVKNFKSQARETERTYQSGESHYFWGKRYILNVKQTDKKQIVKVNGVKNIDLFVRPFTETSERSKLIKEWYRKELKKAVPELIAKWEPVVGVKVNDWGVKQMKTKWGTCNVDAKRIWVNLELAKKPPICLEYIIVHELVHLLERNHTDKFIRYMDEFMPKWRQYRDQLNNLPVVHNDWGY